MKCPRCGLVVTDSMPTCRGCGFSLGDLERRLRQTPARSSLVNDIAGLLSVDQRASLEDRLHELQQHLGGEIIVVTVKSTRPLKPSEYVFWLFNHWQVGGKDHLGLMVLLAEKERRIECEVGYGWEPILSDAESGQVLDRYVLPLLQTGKFYEALRQGTGQLATIIEQALPPEQQAPEDPLSERSES